MPLHERWEGGVIGETTNSTAMEGRLQQWRDALSVESDVEVLARRLAFDGVDLATCRSFLGSVRLADDQPLPAWAERLSVFLQRCPYACENVAQPFFDPDKPLPFQDLWSPFVQCATQELRSRAGSALYNLSENAIRSFQTRLLGALAHLAALPLALEFELLVAQHDPLAILPRREVNGAPPGKDLYCRFVANLLHGGLLGFFGQYAVLARLISVAAGYWAEFVAEFCRRLGEDRPALSAQFYAGQDLGPVVAANLGVSDPHHRGRSVVICTFASGLRIVYKPKDLGIDSAYSALVEWLNERSGPLRLRIPKLLNRSTHGWVEFVENMDCEDSREVERYYHRIGMLLTLTYVLGGTDFHLENVIANGEQPVLVDLETLLQPLVRSFDLVHTFSADRVAAEIMHASVLRTGLLPFWRSLNPGKSFDVSAIGAEGVQDTGHPYLAWENINTDGMQLVHRNSAYTPKSNLPRLSGEMISARDYAAEMARGFAAAYRLLLNRREELLAAKGVMRLFRGLKVRTVLRATGVYDMIAQRLFHPEFLRDGADRSIELDRLAVPFLALPATAETSALWEIYRAELTALERLDVPFFSSLSDARPLFADEQMVSPEFFSESGLQRTMSSIRRLSEADLVAQSNFIRASMHARFKPELSQDLEAPSAKLAEKHVDSLTRAELIAAAVAIANQIRSSAIRGHDGGATWLSLSFNFATEKMSLVPMTDNLYDGRIGVAFFLAALEHVTGGVGFHGLTLAALRPSRQAVRQLISPVASWGTLGAATGLGSQLYGLLRIGKWLGNNELLDLAGEIAAWFIPQRIARDEALDVVGGGAGGILGLLAWSAVQHNGDAPKMASVCARHLLEKRIYTDTGHRAWCVPWASRPLTGFAHGAAGIAYALLRLAQATGDGHFSRAAQEGIAYETAVYSDDARNWPDFREVWRARGESFGVAWCSGATGIGLARLGGLSVLDTPGIREDIANALETTLATSTHGADHICCGNMGRGEFLIEASRRLGRPELFDEARRRASWVVRRAARSGGYRLFATAPGLTDTPAFFQGIAGIGYALLRLAEPERLPCVLLWE